MLYGSRVPAAAAVSPSTSLADLSDPLTSRVLTEVAFTVSLALDAEDRATLKRAGVVLPEGDAVRVSLSDVNEVVYLLDRAAEDGDAPAAALAAYLLVSCDAVCGFED
jgi:hypothetical protein